VLDLRSGPCCRLLPGVEAARTLAAVVSIAGAVIGQGFTATTPVSTPEYRLERLDHSYRAEGAGVGDFNKDGAVDVVSGAYWYAGPRFDKRTAYRTVTSFSVLGYADVFFSWGEDFNGDGWDDVLVVGFPGAPAVWFENPRTSGPMWKAYLVHNTVDNESPCFVDVDGDNRRDLVCMSGQRVGYLTRDPNSPTKPWRFHAISPPLAFFGPFTHGLGVGDIDGDGRKDILINWGWWKQPASLANDPIWTPFLHVFSTARGGAQMHAYDIDGDGDNDVVSSLDAHGFGLSWFEQRRVGGAISFTEHPILPASGRHPDQFSQLHALTVHDMDGDGLRDIVTGKCYLAHNGADPQAYAPAVLYRFRLVRTPSVRFVPELIHADTGVGRQVTVADLNADGRPDVLVGNKKGTSLLLRKP